MVKPLFGTPLNRAHPLAQGLVGCWLLNEGGGLIAYDSSGRGNHLAAGGSPYPTWSSGAHGSALLFGAAVSSGRYTRAASPASLPMSTAMGVRAIALESNNILWSVGHSWPPGVQTLSSTVRFNEGSYYTEAAVDATNHHAIVTTESAAGALALYVDALTPTTNTGTPTGVIEHVNLGNGYAGGSGANALIDYMMMWNRVLTAAEARLVNAVPFCMFDPPGYGPGTSQIGTPLYGVSI